MTDAAIRAAQRAAAIDVGAPIEPESTGPVAYVGLVSRAVAIVIDAAILNLIAVVTGASVALLMDTLSMPSQTRSAVAVIGGAVYGLWVVGYFVAFWAVTGQTLGDRIMGFRVQPAHGARLKPRRALVRFGALVLSAIPLGAGFLPVLFDDRRRGFHDRVARTVVVVGGADHPQKKWRG